MAQQDVRYYLCGMLLETEGRVGFGGHQFEIFKGPFVTAASDSTNCPQPTRVAWSATRWSLPAIVFTLSILMPNGRGYAQASATTQDFVLRGLRFSIPSGHAANVSSTGGTFYHHRKPSPIRLRGSLGPGWDRVRIILAVTRK